MQKNIRRKEYALCHWPINWMGKYNFEFDLFMLKIEEMVCIEYGLLRCHFIIAAYDRNQMKVPSSGNIKSMLDYTFRIYAQGSEYRRYASFIHLYNSPKATHYF